MYSPHELHDLLNTEAEQTASAIEGAITTAQSSGEFSHKVPTYLQHGRGVLTREALYRVAERLERKGWYVRLRWRKYAGPRREWEYNHRIGWYRVGPDNLTGHFILEWSARPFRKWYYLWLK